jgi:hypothetical protein
MAAIITEKFRTHNAKQFKEDFGETASSTYIFIGRSHPWTDDTSPPVPVNGTSEEMDAFSDMLSMKKVSTADVSHALTRYDWTTGTNYDEYAHDYSSSNVSPGTSANNLFSAKFFVLTDDYNVYKCIRTGRNSSGSVVASTVKPTGTSATDLVYTSDTGAAQGYIWKYMYTVSAADTIKYVTSDFIPGTYTAVPIDGDGSSATCSVTVGAGGAITSVAVTTSAYGSGYNRASIDVASISGIGSGSSAVLTPIISPMNGHGADPVEELGGNYIIVNSRFEFNEGSGDFPTDNDFRRIGLLQDPFTAGTTTVATATTLGAYYKMTLSSVSGLSVDDIILNASSDGNGVAVSRIVSINGSVVSHQPIANSEGGYVNFAQDDTVYKNGAVIGNADSLDSAFPEVERFTGNILYIENRGAVTRAADQIEDIKLIIEM